MYKKSSPTEPIHNRTKCIKHCGIRSKAAMSLMEISIVIIILGLLTTAIIGGASIRKMAGQKHMINSINSMANSLILFKQTYGYWPGDFPSANEVFGPLSKIIEKCPMIDNYGNSIRTSGVSGNGDGLIGTDEDGTPVKDWGSETMFMACHMLLAQLAPPTMQGSGMRANQHVNIHTTTSPTHSSFGGEKMLHLPTYSSSFLTYGSTNTGLPAVQINSNKNIHKEILPFIMLAKSNRSLAVNIHDIFLAEEASFNQKKDFKVKPQATQTAAIALRRYAAAIASSLYSTAEAAGDPCNTSLMDWDHAQRCVKHSATVPAEGVAWVMCDDIFGGEWKSCYRISGWKQDHKDVTGKNTIGNGTCICKNQWDDYYVMLTPRIEDKPPVDNPASATLTDPPSSHLLPTHIYLPVSE